MGVAITFCDNTEHERRENKHDDLFFGRSEAESLPRLIQFEAPAFCNHERTLTDTNSEVTKILMTRNRAKLLRKSSRAGGAGRRMLIRCNFLNSFDLLTLLSLSERR